MTTYRDRTDILERLQSAGILSNSTSPLYESSGVLDDTGTQTNTENTGLLGGMTSYGTEKQSTDTKTDETGWDKAQSVVDGAKSLTGKASSALNVGNTVTGGLLSPVSSVAGLASKVTSLGSLAMNTLGDFAGLRSYDGFRDRMESQGASYAESKAATEKQREVANQASKDAKDIGMTDQGGYKGLGIGNPSSYGGKSEGGNSGSSGSSSGGMAGGGSEDDDGGAGWGF